MIDGQTVARLGVPQHDVSILHFIGDLDSLQTASVRHAFAGVEAGGPVLIDLSDVPFVDSAGLGALIGGIRRVKEASGLSVIAGPRTGVARLLALTGVDRMVPVVPSVAAALEMLAAPRDDGDRAGVP